MQVPGDDLEQALRWRTGERIDLERTEDVDTHILDYLRDSVEVLDADGEACPIHWVGKEVELFDAWVYFEIPVATGHLGCKLRNRLFFEMQDDQVNTVQFQIRERDGEIPYRTTLRFSREQSAWRLEAEGPEPTAWKRKPPPELVDPDPPLLRTNFDKLVAPLCRDLSQATSPQDEPLTPTWRRELLDVLQTPRAEELLSTEEMWIQVALLQALSAHPETARVLLERARLKGGSHRTVQRVRTTLRRMAGFAEQTGRVGLGERLIELEGVMRLEL